MVYKSDGHNASSYDLLGVWQPPLSVARIKFVGERHVSQRAHTRAAAQEAACAAAERELTPFSDVIYDSCEHYDRSKLMRTRKVLNERIIQIPGEGRDSMIQRIQQLGWDYMYNDLVDINVTIVKEFYSNFSTSAQRTDPIPRAQDTYEINKARRAIGDLNISDVLATIAALGMTWDRYKPKVWESGQRNPQEGSSGLDENDGKRDQRLAFLVLLTRLAIAYNVPTYPEDNIMIIEEKDKYQEKRKARKGDLPRTAPPPIPPPIHEA
ncbi:hypothetical protein PIB30_029837 [Stylosanthes scabra]|uniref:DRBM domain-containing protein n=1 Tax=Stylosanthes scabra TaxID=79078 RepID=A0ABU6WEF5_9FABA|nr:hypothetical protein [Stylosanthes scabra]